MRRLVPALLLALFAACSSSNQNAPADAGACAKPCGAACCGAEQACDEATKICVSCTRKCPGNCGDDGCGGTCGTCSETQTCEGGQCKACGTIVCGGECCAEDEICDPVSRSCMVCTPSCEGKTCGDNGCGGLCPPGCTAGQKCVNGKCADCLASSQCPYNQLCGTDPNGCTCGTCSADQYCLDNSCAYCSRPLCSGTCCLEGEICDPQSLSCVLCQPKCQGKSCGPDGCGGTCAPGCATGQACGATTGTCSACSPACGTRKCGPDKNGCVCGECSGNDTCVDGLCQPCARPLCNGVCCPSGTTCDANGHCSRCEPQCQGKSCGDDGCGGVCGLCDTGKSCANGSCQACTPNCAGKSCGDDGCGGKCGSDCDMQKGLFCIAGKCTQCMPEKDEEMCARVQAECGSLATLDNCGNYRGPVCGTCIDGKECDPSTHTCKVPCLPETDAAFCTRLGRVCGPASGTDNCGAARYVTSCGTCTGKTCVSGKCQ